jgi:hypothetical protein
MGKFDLVSHKLELTKEPNGQDMEERILILEGALLERKTADEGPSLGDNAFYFYLKIVHILFLLIIMEQPKLHL